MEKRVFTDLFEFGNGTVAGYGCVVDVDVSRGKYAVDGLEGFICNDTMKELLEISEPYLSAQTFQASILEPGKETYETIKALLDLAQSCDDLEDENVILLAAEKLIRKERKFNREVLEDSEKSPVLEDSEKSPVQKLADARDLFYQNRGGCGEGK